MHWELPFAKDRVCHAASQSVLDSAGQQVTYQHLEQNEARNVHHLLASQSASQSVNALPVSQSVH